MCEPTPTLENPSFETKQKILRLVVERVEFVEDQITIKHVIPISDVRLRRNQLGKVTPEGLKLTCWFVANCDNRMRLASGREIAC